MLSKFIGLVLALATFFIALWASSYTISSFIDLPSLAFVVVITSGLMIFKFGVKSLIFWTIKDDEYRNDIAHWSGKACLNVGILGTIIGLMIISENYKNTSNFGSALAVALLSLFYSYILYLFLFFPHTKGR